MYVYLRESVISIWLAMLIRRLVPQKINWTHCCKTMRSNREGGSCPNCPKACPDKITEWLENSHDENFELPGIIFPSCAAYS